MNYLAGSLEFDIITGVLCLALLASSAATDFVCRRIPNYITIPFFIVGLILTGLVAPLDYIVKITAALAVFLFGMTGLLGLGDIKLIMALCVIWNPIYVMCAILVVSMLIVVVDYVKKPSLARPSLMVFLSLELMRAREYLAGRRKPCEKNKENSVPFSFYMLISYIFVQGGLLLWRISV